MLHYRIHDFLRTELLVWNWFKSEVFHLRAAMKTQHLPNVWKAALAPFAPSNYATGLIVVYCFSFHF